MKTFWCLIWFSAGLAQGGIQWAVSQNHLCMLSQSALEKKAPSAEVACWNADADRLPVPPLKNPRQLAVGYHLGGIVGDYSCAITDEGVQCWGEQGTRLNRFFSNLKNPTHLASGFADVCVAHATGVRCYGSREIPWTTVSKAEIPLADVVELSVGTFYACALTLTKKVHCWGGVDNAYLKLLTEPAESDLTNLAQAMQRGPGELESPRSLSVGLAHACLLDEARPVCWGLEKKGEWQAPAEIKFREIQAGTYQTCGISFGRLLCWGLKDEPLDRLAAGARAGSVSVRLTPESFPAFRNYCVANENEIVCTGKLQAGRPFRISHSAYGFTLLNFEDELDRASFYVYQSQRIIFQQLSQALKQEFLCRTENREECLKARVLMMLALQPILENITSEYFQTAILPRYQSVLELAKEMTGVSTLKQAGYHKAQLRAALKTTATVVLSLRSQLKDAKELEMLTAFQASLGLALAAGGTPDTLAEAKALGRELKDLWQDLAGHARTAGAAIAIQALLQYFEGT